MIFISMEKKTNQLNEVMEINGNIILIENGLVKQIIDESNKPTDYIDVETAFGIIDNEIDKIYQNEL